MMEKLKKLFGTVIGWILIIAFLLLVIFALNWFVNHFDNVLPVLNTIEAVVIGILILAVLVSIFPKSRYATGTVIIWGSWIMGAKLWLINLYVSATLLGYFWTIIGVVFFGVGVFITSAIGLLLSGQFSGLFSLLLYLLVIYGIRFLGIFITAKHRTATQSAFQSITSTEDSATKYGNQT